MHSVKLSKLSILLNVLLLRIIIEWADSMIVVKLPPEKTELEMIIFEDESPVFYIKAYLTLSL